MIETSYIGVFEVGNHAFDFKIVGKLTYLNITWHKKICEASAYEIDFIMFGNKRTSKNYQKLGSYNLIIK